MQIQTKQITSKVTINTSPTYHNHFWKFHEMVKMWNEDMAAFFSLGWCGWMKACPSGTSDGIPPSGCFVLKTSFWQWISYCMLLIVWGSIFYGGGRGKGWASWTWNLRVFVKSRGKFGGLSLHMLKPIFYYGCYVFLDSGFCVLKTLIALKKKGVFATSLIINANFGPLLFQ